MFEGGLAKFRAFIIEEWTRDFDGTNEGFDWEEDWLADMLPNNPACYLDELESTFGEDLRDRLNYAIEGGSSRTDGLRAALERFNLDSKLRRAFVESVRDDAAQFSLFRRPTLGLICAFDEVGFDLMQMDLLHLVSESNYADAVPYLLAKGFDVDGLNEVGDTPLHVAANYGSEECIIALLNAGADSTKVDDDGKTAADILPFVNVAIAKRRAEDESASMAAKHGITVGNPRNRGGGKPL